MTDFKYMCIFFLCTWLMLLSFFIMTLVKVAQVENKVFDVKEAIMQLNSQREADKSLKFLSNPKSDLFFSMPDKKPMGHVGR